MRRFIVIVIALLLTCALVYSARSAFSQTLTSKIVNTIAANPEYSRGARLLHAGAVVSIREMSAADRRTIKKELLQQYPRIYEEVQNKTALDVFGFAMFLSEVRNGDPFYAREWLKQTHWDAFNDVLVEVVLANKLSESDPLPGLRVLLSLAWDDDAATRKYARFVLHRAFFDLIHADPNINTLDDVSVDSLESLLNATGKWTFDPTYTERWEADSLEGKPTGSLLIPAASQLPPKNNGGLVFPQSRPKGERESSYRRRASTDPVRRNWFVRTASSSRSSLPRGRACGSHQASPGPA